MISRRPDDELITAEFADARDGGDTSRDARLIYFAASLPRESRAKAMMVFTLIISE